MIPYPLDLPKLKAFAPGGKLPILTALEAAEPALDAAGILENPLRLCHFMAQIFVESGGFRALEENLSYSAERLLKVWPKRFKDLADAGTCARQPQALANRVYGGRMGNTKEGDGYRFRGRGLKQLTGRDNYRAFSRWAQAQGYNVDFEEDPDLVAKGQWAVLSAVWFWQANDLNRLADKNDIRAITRKVNGGENGFADRRAAFRKACDVWDAEETVSRIGKPASQSKIGKASIVGLIGSASAGVPAAVEAVDQATTAVNTGRGLSDAIGMPFITLVLIVLVIGLLLYILRDRAFLAKTEGV